MRHCSPSGECTSGPRENRPFKLFRIGTVVVVSGVEAISLENHTDIDVPEHNSELESVGKALYNRIIDMQERKV